MRALVRGAGVAGLTVAFELRRHGHAVEIVDRTARAGAGASGLAGGMLAPFCEGESAPEAVTRLGRAAAEWWEAALPGQVNRDGTLVVAPPRDTGELTRVAARRVMSGWTKKVSPRSSPHWLDGSARRCSSARKRISTRARPSLRFTRSW